MTDLNLDSIKTVENTSCSDQEKKILGLPLDFIPAEVLRGGLTAFAEHLAGRSHLVTVPAALEEDNGQEVETRSTMQILLVDFGIGNFAFSERVRPCDRCDGEPAFLPLSSSRTSALEWLQIAPDERARRGSPANCHGKVGTYTPFSKEACSEEDDHGPRQHLQTRFQLLWA